MHRVACMQPSANLVIHGHSVDLLLNDMYLNCLPFQLVFHQIVNTTSTPIGMEGR